MRLAIDIFTVVAVSAGILFFVAGTLGLLRFPDTLTWLHALSKADNIGLGLVALGLLPQVDGLISALKLISVWLLVQLSGAIVTQLIARAVRDAELESMMASFFDIILVVLLVAIAAWTIVARNTTRAVIVFIVYGLLLSLAWVKNQCDRRGAHGSCDWRRRHRNAVAERCCDPALD